MNPDAVVAIPEKAGESSQRWLDERLVHRQRLHHALGFASPQGGKLPAAWHAWLLEALAGGCDIVSGLHTFLSDDPELAAAARRSGRTITDARKPPADVPVASGLARDVEPLVVLTVGTDCNVGKMTAQLQLVADELGFRYVRFHAIFHDVLGTVRKREGTISYDWSKLDELYAGFSYPTLDRESDLDALVPVIVREYAAALTDVGLIIFAAGYHQF